MASSSNADPVDGKQELKLPFGYRFDPTSKEIIMYYLKHKIFGGQLPADIIPTIDVYGQNPDQIPFDRFKYGVDGEWFFFTTRPSGDILTKDGYWHPTDLPIEIDHEGKIVGFKQVIDFYSGIPPNGTKSNWTIFEFRLNPDALEANQVDHLSKDKVQNFVACRIRDLDKFKEVTDCIKFTFDDSKL